MKWNFILRGITLSAGGWAGGQGLGETSWTLQSNQSLPAQFRQSAGKAVLLKLARELCSKEGGRIVVVENGKANAAWEWRDAGELDAEASGAWYEKKLDPRDFRSII